MSGNSSASNNSNDERQYTLIEHGGMKYYLNENTRKIYMLSKGRYIYFGKLKPGASIQNFTFKQVEQNSENDNDDNDDNDDNEDNEDENDDDDENVIITYYGMKFSLDESNGDIRDIKTDKLLGKLWEENPVKIVFFTLTQPLLPLVKISRDFFIDKKFDVYEGDKQVGYLLKLDISGLQLKDNVLTTIGKYDIISLDKKLYVLVIGVSKSEEDFNQKIKSLKGIKEEIRLIQEQKKLEKSESEVQLTVELAEISGKIVDILEKVNLETTPEKQLALKKQLIQMEKDRLAIDNSIKSNMLKTLRSNIASIRQLNGDLAAKSAGEEYLKQKKGFETETKAQEQKIQHLELELESEVFNTDNSTETVEMTEVDYFGKVYLIDMKSKDVYEQIEEEYKLVGTVIEDTPIKIKFFKMADWKEEYTDLEPREYKGKQYVVNPITKNVFLLDTETHVGEIVTLEPLVLRIYDEVEQPEQTKEEEQEEEEMIEVEIIVFQGTKFVRGPHGFIYNKKFELVGKWDYIDKQIDYIPTRSFLNFSSSCYIDSLLFALFYRSSSFIEKQILRKDIHSMLRTLRIADPSIKSAINENQKELVKLYKWLHRLEQTENATRVCQPFRMVYKNVELEKKPIAYHDKLIEKHLGDSSEFLIGLFNGFGIKTMVKTLKASGKEGDEIREYSNYTEQIPPIILLNSRSTPDNYYQNRTVSLESKGKKFTVYNITDEDDLEREKELLGRIKIEKINILLQFFKSKLKIPKSDRDAMKYRIDEISSSKILQDGFKDIESIFFTLNTTKNFYPKELKELEESIETNTNILEKLVELAQLREKYKFEFTEKIDDTIYEPIDGETQDYIILSVDRGKQRGRDFVRDQTPFNLQETIPSPIGEPLELQFVIKYIDSPKHYVCYFKNIEDDLWYLYDDRYKTFKIVTTGKLDKNPGTFEKMKAEVATNCTVLFYAKQLI